MFSIRPNPNNIQRLRSDKDKIYIKETAGVHKLEYI